MALTYYFDFSFIWKSLNIGSRFSCSTIYLYNILNKMIILGISAYYHDSACCLIKNGEIISAIQEERLTRKKHDASFPKNL